MCKHARRRQGGENRNTEGSACSISTSVSKIAKPRMVVQSSLIAHSYFYELHYHIVKKGEEKVYSERL